jgi:hypothetical protein
LIFETMVFNGSWDQDFCRYSTQVEAVIGHLNVVERLAAGLEPWPERVRGSF